MDGKTRENPFLTRFFTSTVHEMIHSRIHYARDKPQCKLVTRGMNMTDSFGETSRELEGVHLAVERMETCAMRY